MTITPGLALWLALAAVWILYTPGIGGAFHFDDEASLAGLRQIVDIDSALTFIFSGATGPTGRPLSLATFAVQHYAWPDDPGAFLRTNILIHMLNACLVAWLALAISLIRGEDNRKSAWIAVVTAAIWALMPLLVSSSLFVIQRMTTFSATLVLLALIVYLKARQHINARPNSSLALMTVAIGAGTVLSALAKENGILLPVFVLALEFTIFVRPASIGPMVWKAWTTVMIVIPLVAIGVFLALQLPYDESTINTRHFDGGSRLLAQAHILWIYLINAFIPFPASLGPFHDDYSIAGTSFLIRSTAAVLLWTGLIVVAYLLCHKAPEIALATIWFLGGHLLESTTVPLELYFEHRNYIPVIGPVFAIVSRAATGWAAVSRTHILALLFIYLASLSLSLYNQAANWGNPRIAADMWAMARPNSARALSFLTQALEQEGDYQSSIKEINAFIDRNPNAQHAHLLRLIYACARFTPFTAKIRNHNYQPVADPIGIAMWASESFEKVYQLHLTGRCPDLSESEIVAIGTTLLEVPEVGASALARHNINALLATIWINNGDFKGATAYLDRALTAYPSLDTLETAIRAALAMPDRDRAQTLLKTAEAHPPRNPFLRSQWEREIRRLEGLMAAPVGAIAEGNG